MDLKKRPNRAINRTNSNNNWPLLILFYIYYLSYKNNIFFFFSLKIKLKDLLNKGLLYYSNKFISYLIIVK